MYCFYVFIIGNSVELLLESRFVDYRSLNKRHLSALAQGYLFVKRLRMKDFPPFIISQVIYNTFRLNIFFSEKSLCS